MLNIFGEAPASPDIERGGAGAAQSFLLFCARSASFYGIIMIHVHVEL